MLAARARTALAVLAALNLLNYVDRSILYQVQPLIEREFNVSKFQIGLLSASFIACLSIAVLLAGLVADRRPRRPLIVGGAVMWSLATLLTGLTSSFGGLLVRHAIVGVGEACMVAGPGYIADLFPAGRRARAMAVFVMASPVGTALGYIIGGVLADSYGWRAPFCVLALPGILVAMLLLLAPEPERGVQDGATGSLESAPLASLLRNRAFLSVTAGMVLVAFALGGAQTWMPDFLMTGRGMTMVGAAHFIGAATVVGGLLAMWSAGWLADRLRARRHDGDYLLGALTTATAVPLALASLFLPRPAMYPAVFLTIFFLLFNLAPMATAVVEAVPPRLRSTAIAVYVVAQFLVGAATAPPVVGFVTDWTGSFEIGFLPVVAAVAAACPIFWWARRYAPVPRFVPESTVP